MERTDLGKESVERMGNKPTPFPKNDLEKKSVECVTNNFTKAVVDKNPLLGFVEGTNVVDTMHPEGMVPQGYENLSGLADTETQCGKGENLAH